MLCDLPDSLILHTFGMLDLPTLLLLSRVCKTFKELIDEDDLLWHTQFSKIANRRDMPRGLCKQRLQNWVSLRPFSWTLPSPFPHSAEHVNPDHAVVNDAYPLGRMLARAVALDDTHMLLFGGHRNPRRQNLVYFADVWLLNIHTMKFSLIEVSEAARPSARTSSTCVALSSTQLFMFGGQNSDGSYGDDCWVCTVDVAARTGKWTLLETHGDERPEGRWGHTATIIGSKIYFFGGSKPNRVFNDFWVFSIADKTWEQVKPSLLGAMFSVVPKPRAGHSASAVGSSIYIFGGNSIDEVFNEVWTIDVDKLSKGWTALQPTGTPPPGVVGSSCSTIGSRLVIFGGRNAIQHTFPTGVSVLDVSTAHAQWHHLTVHQHYTDAHGCPPDKRTGHAVVAHPSGLLCFGGMSIDEKFVNDCYVLNLFGADCSVPPATDAADTTAGEDASRMEVA